MRQGTRGLWSPERAASCERLRYYSTQTQSSSTVPLFRSVVSYRGPSVELQRPVVILHGLFGSYLNWRTIAKRLVQSTKTDAFLFDLRNHGSSPHADEMTYDVMVEDIKAALKEEKNIRAAQLLGHSMGGMVSMKMALKYPSLVKRLIVVDIAPTTDPADTPTSETDPLAGYLRAMRKLDLSRVKSRDEADILLESDVKDPVVRAFLVTNLVVASQGNGDTHFKWRIPLDILNSSIDHLRNFDMSKEVQAGKTFDGPTLFIGGGRSKYIKEKSLPIIQKLFPRASVKVIPDAGHWVQAEKPNEFVEIVNQFIARTASHMQDDT